MRVKPHPIPISEMGALKSAQMINAVLIVIPHHCKRPTVPAAPLRIKAKVFRLSEILRGNP